jgi:predicted nucleotide-binding protein
MKALAWDDEPDGYLKDLAEHLADDDIDVVVCGDEKRFLRLLNDPNKKWDFVITDLVKANQPAVLEKDARVGADLAVRVKDLPVFMITQHYNKVDPASLGIPSHVILRSKSTDAGWQAADICDELRRRGLFTNPRKVFLIYGHDRTAPGTTTAIEKHLKGLGVEIVKVMPETLFADIATGLVEKMHDCAAIIAVCTPDDHVLNSDGNYYQPRQNVLLEIGLALGLARGMTRLTIVQKYGTTVEKIARLPSDLGGMVPIRFKARVADKFEELDTRLRKLGVKLSKRAGR